MNLVLPLAAVAVGYALLSSSTTPSAASEPAPAPVDPKLSDFESKVEQLVNQAEYMASTNASRAAAGEPPITPQEFQENAVDNWQKKPAGFHAAMAVLNHIDAMNVAGKKISSSEIEVVPRPQSSPLPPLSPTMAQIVEEMSRLLEAHAIYLAADPSERAKLATGIAVSRAKIDKVSSGKSAREVLSDADFA